MPRNGATRFWSISDASAKGLFPAPVRNPNNRKILPSILLGLALATVEIKATEHRVVAPGGFVNRAPKAFKDAAPAEVMGTRARQLALPVIFPSPLTGLCDRPQNYRGQSVSRNQVAQASAPASSGGVSPPSPPRHRDGALTRSRDGLRYVAPTFLSAGAGDFPVPS
jgi:hypothetical protein